MVDSKKNYKFDLEVKGSRALESPKFNLIQSVNDSKIPLTTISPWNLQAPRKTSVT